MVEDDPFEIFPYVLYIILSQQKKGFPGWMAELSFLLQLQTLTGLNT